MNEPHTAEKDAAICRTCLRRITHETRVEVGRFQREGWYDDARVDAIVCFKARDYRHVPLSDRERACYEAGIQAAVAGVRAWCSINEIAEPPLDWEGLGEFLAHVLPPEGSAP